MSPGTSRPRKAVRQNHGLSWFVFGGLRRGRAEARAGQLEDKPELRAMGVDGLAGGEERVRVGHDELLRERAEIASEAREEPRRPVLVRFRESVEVGCDRALDPLPVEAELRKGVLHERAELAASFGAGPADRLQRLGAGVQREQDPLLDLPCARLSLAVGEDELATAAANRQIGACRPRAARGPRGVRRLVRRSGMCDALPP